MPLMHKIRSALIASSIESYLLTRGNCPCPYLRDAADRRCGKSSCKPQGKQPLCFDEDITEENDQALPQLAARYYAHRASPTKGRCLHLTLCAPSPPRARSTHRLAPLPRLGSGRPARESDGLLVQEHHHDLRPGTLLVAGHYVREPVTVVVSGDVVPARRPDVRPVDLEVAGAQAPLPINRIGSR